MHEMSLDSFREFLFRSMNAQSDNHFGYLGLECRFIEVGRAGMDLPYNPKLAGSPTTGVMAGGPMTALMDTCCAVAAATARETIGFAPTLDLRMDHMGLAEPGKVLRADAEAYRVTRSVIFTRGIIYHDDPDRPIARGLVNFTPIAHQVTTSTPGDDGSGGRLQRGDTD